MAATEARPGTDPDYTVGIRVEHDRQTGVFYVTDLVRMRGTAGEVEATVRRTAERDGKRVHIYIEQEGGSSGKALVHHYRTGVLSGFPMRAERPSGDKVTRAYPVASRAEAGDVKVAGGAWSAALLDELEVFPQGRHDDQVDALSAAIAMHSTRRHLMVIPTALGEVNRGLSRQSPWQI